MGLRCKAFASSGRDCKGPRRGFVRLLRAGADARAQLRRFIGLAGLQGRLAFGPMSGDVGATLVVAPLFDRGGAMVGAALVVAPCLTVDMPL